MGFLRGGLWGTQQFAQQQHAQWGPVREETAWTPAGGPGVSTWGMPPPQSSAKYNAPFQGAPDHHAVRQW